MSITIIMITSATIAITVIITMPTQRISHSNSFFIFVAFMTPSQRVTAHA